MAWRGGRPCDTQSRKKDIESAMTMTSVGSAVELLTVIAVIAAYGSGVWGIYAHFVTDGKVDPWMNITSLCSLVGLLWFLAERIHHHASGQSLFWRSDLLSLSLLAIFTSLFWWTIATTRRRRLTLAFSKDQPCFIHTAGPYAWSRHPFYTSYIVFWVAVAVAAADAFFWLMPLIMAFIYLRAARMEEVKFATSPLSAQYDSYRVKTGMLFTIPSVVGKLGLGRDARNDVS